MPQEIENRLMLAATVIYDDNGVPSLLINQGFASVQHEDDGALGIGVCILRPDELPATEGNMLVQMTHQVVDGVAAAGAANFPAYTIVGPDGLAATPYAANVRAAAQPGDVLCLVDEDPPENLSFAMTCTQVTPADG